MRSIAAFCATAMIAILGLASPAAAVPGPIIGLDPISYTEGDGKVPVAPNATITQVTSYADGYIEFSIAGATLTETLSLPQAETISTVAGATSVVGAAIYLGLGVDGYKQIASIDPVKNGTAGRPLRINFTAPLENAGFEGAKTGAANVQVPAGWTVNHSRVALDPTWSRSQGRPLVYASNGGGQFTMTQTTAGYSYTTNFDYKPASGARSQWLYESDVRAMDHGENYGSNVVDYGGRTNALQLSQGGNCTENTGSTYCALFGPEAISSQFAAKAGDSLAFDWAAKQTSDHFEVYGLLEKVDGTSTTVLAYSRGETLPWGRATGIIPEDGTYRFRFIAGSYDKTGGLVVGAEFYIDNIRVLSSDANEVLATSLLNQVLYENTSDNPPATRTISVVTAPPGETPTTQDVPTAVTMVDDAPRWGAAPTWHYTNAAAIDTFDPLTGRFNAVDPEGDSIEYSVPGTVIDARPIGGVAMTRSVVTDQGTLHFHHLTGDYAFVPNAPALNAAYRAGEQEFVITATANGLATPSTHTLTWGPSDSAPGAPTLNTVTPGDGEVALDVTAPDFMGHATAVGYDIEFRSAGSSTWSAASIAAGDPLVVPGLVNGTEYEFRVLAVNAKGSSAPSGSLTATPRTVPGAPTLTALVEGPGKVTVAWDAPVVDGGAPISGYRLDISTDGGVTWTTRVADTASTETTATLDGLTNGREVHVRVSALNAAGAGNESNVLAATPKTVPAALDITSVASGNGAVTVAFAPPADDGGSPITAYQYSIDGGRTWIDVPNPGAGEFTIYGLKNGTSVDIAVRSVNGVGPATPTVRSATPAAAPVMPKGHRSPKAPGAGSSTVNGATVPVTITDASKRPVNPAPTGTLEVAAGDIGLTVHSQQPDGSDVAAGNDGTLRLVRGGTTTVKGSGFQPGSTVDLWLVSGATSLGTATVGPDGTFSVDIAIPAGLDDGAEMLQVNGLDGAGATRSVTLAAEVLGASQQPPTASPSALAVTGGSIGGLLIAAVVSLTLGGVALRIRRRDEVVAERIA